MIDKENEKYLIFWNEISENWKNLIIPYLPQKINPKHLDMNVYDDKIEPYKIPVFNVNTKLDNNDLITLKNTLNKITQLKIDNSNGTKAVKFESIKPLIFFPNLEQLNIIDYLHLREYSQINDITPISNLINLKTLILECCPINNLDAVINLSKLEKLEVTYSNITSLYSIQNLKTLKHLKFHGSVIDIRPLVNLTNLETLEFSTDSLIDISPLKTLINLKELELQSSNNLNLSSLENLKALTHLSLNYTPIEDISVLKNLTGLESLFLSETKIKDFSYLKYLINLRIIWLHKTKIASLEPLRNLKKLVRIDIDNTSVDNIDPILDLPNLEMISCNKTNISVNQIERLRKHYPNSSISSSLKNKNVGCLTLVVITFFIIYFVI